MPIIPEEDALTAPYWEGARLHELRLQHCLGCGACWHPPMPICPVCHSAAHEWRPSSGRGTVYSCVDVHHSVHPATDGWIPYRICLIDLDEGPRIISNVRHDIEASGLEPGARVVVAFEEVAPGKVLPQFRREMIVDQDGDPSAMPVPHR
jgi:uncharacterized protein